MYIEECQKQSAEATQIKKKPVNATALKSRILRETRLIPKVVFEIEQFSKSVTQISNKTKVDLARFVGQGTARDFRILNLKEVLEHQENSSDTSNLVSTQATGNTTRLSETLEEMEVEEANDHDISTNSEESSPPSSKRAKKQ